MQNRGSANVRDTAYFSADETKKTKQINMPAVDKHHGRTVFCSEKFAKIMHKYDQYTFKYKINNAIVNHSQNEENSRVLYLYWADSKKYYQAIKLSLTQVDQFTRGYSRFLIPEKLSEFAHKTFSYKINPSDGYYRFDVHQRAAYPNGVFEDILLLSLWFTLDGKFGELRYVGHGLNFSANEALRIYKYFAEFFRIQTTFIVDDAHLTSLSNRNIPIRVISALATGKTWFERRIPGMTLFNENCIAVGEVNTVSQSGSARDQSLRELQALKLSEWQKMLPESGKKQLTELYSKFLFNKKTAKTGFSLETVQTLTAAIYNDAKNKKTNTEELVQLSDLLCGNLGIDFGTIPLNKKAPDHWVKSRVKDLLKIYCGEVMYGSTGLKSRPSN